MTTLLSIPTDAPFTLDQRAWLGGYLAGMAAARRHDDETATLPTLTVDIAYGTQTGNSKGGWPSGSPASSRSGSRSHRDRSRRPGRGPAATTWYLLIVTSTYGEGEMPDNAELSGRPGRVGAPRLESARFTVLALGDSSYEGFCQAGKLIDTRLEQLGAKRVVPRVDCDVDFEDPAAEWIAEVVEHFAAEAPDAAGAALPAPVPAPTRAGPLARGSGATRTRPGSSQPGAFGSAQLEGDPALRVRSRRQRHRRTRPATPSGWCRSTTRHSSARCSGGSAVSGDERRGGHHVRAARPPAGRSRTPSRDLLTALSERDPDGDLAAVMARGEQGTLDSWLWGRDTLDLLLASPEGALHGRGAVRRCCDRCSTARTRSRRARSHSPGSRSTSPWPSVRYNEAGRVRGGRVLDVPRGPGRRRRGGGCTCSRTRRFRVPEDDDAPMIMVGPGTGVAPFRAFLQERRPTGHRPQLAVLRRPAPGHDFIYEEELAAVAGDGVLHRLDLAFSRDQAQKVYVQDPDAASTARELYAWLEDGAHFYVCGDANRMAKDVDAALRLIIEQQRGGMSRTRSSTGGPEEGEALRPRDVY